MARLQLALLSAALIAVAACGGRELAPAGPTTIAPDAGVADAARDAAQPPDTAIDAAVGAVVVPGDDIERPPLEEVDTTVHDDDLAAPPTRKPRHVDRGGRQLVALQARNEDHRVVLALVEDDNGIVASFPLIAGDGSTSLHGFDGNTYSPRNHLMNYDGPIVFAIRTRSRADAPWQQVVIVSSGSLLRVLTRPLGTDPARHASLAWRSLLDLQLRDDATFVGIGTTDPH